MAQKKGFGLRDLQLDQHSQTPFYRQVYERIRDAIVAGILRPTERLPSTRSLASQLATARATIDLAYSLLSAEGYILSRGAGGTFVAPALSGLVKAPATKGKSAPRAAPAQAFQSWPLLPFQMGVPALDAFPGKLWGRLASRRARALPLEAMSAPDPLGYAPLRAAITSYLAVSRGILCAPEQVIVTSGFQAGLGLITRAFLQPGDSVWLEDPGYFMARKGLEAAGARLVPVAVDAEGMSVTIGIKRAPRARFAYVTPSHQAPLGVALSLPRRLALLAWATKAGAWIIEDDYDSEFRYGSRPLPALKSLDESGRVLYVGSFSKVLFPGVRLGYLVVPPAQIERVNRICQLLYRDRPVFNQGVVADFMVEGHFARHIKRMRTLYEERRGALAAALTEICGKQLTIQLQAGGMHLLARFADLRSDVELVKRARAGGLAPSAFSLWGMELGRAEQGILLSFTNMPQESAREMAHRLRGVL